MFDYAGAFHIHTNYSFDGTTGIGDVIAAAQAAALDFIVVTDHFRMDARTDGWEGWRNGVLVIVGEEISPRHNHYLALGIQAPVLGLQKEAKPQEYIDAVRHQGGVGLIAHPDHTGAPGFGVKEYAWQDWAVDGFDGISIWDLMTDWQELLRSLPAAVKAYLFPVLSLTGPKKETLARWDALWGKRNVAGYGEIDNHDTRKKVFGIVFRIFPFAFAFSTIRTHVLLDEPLSTDAARARQQVYAAIKHCRLYVAQERWRKAKGFDFRIQDGSRAAAAGDDFVLQGRADIAVTLPDGKPARVRVLRDGTVIAEAERRQCVTEIREHGIYRVEVLQRRFGRWLPWIYSNPIRVL
jgi:hypothetical protein